MAFLFFKQFHSPEFGRYELGPILRTEFASIGQTPGFAQYIKYLEPELVFAATIGGEQAHRSAQEFEQQCVVVGVPLSAVWQIEELYSGAPYRRVAGESAHSLGPFTSGATEWEEGSVAEIVAAPAMASFVRRGELPAISREESLSYFETANSSVTRGKRRNLSEDCISHAQSLLGALMDSDPSEAELMVDSLLADFQDIIDQVISLQLAEDDVENDSDLLEQAAMYFGHTSLRDALLDLAVTDYAEAFYVVCIAVARKTVGEVRAHALCCAAMSASFIGRGHRVSQALELAESASPGHRLTFLMQQALHCGGLALLYEACVEGAHLARAKLLSG